MVLGAAPFEPCQQNNPDTLFLLRVRHLSVRFPWRRGWLRGSRRWVRAVNDVSFDIEAGQALGLVGESGCGKTTVGRSILRLIPPTSGEIRFDGVDLRTQTPRQLHSLRRQMGIVFQDPVGSLNPRMTVEQIVGEGLEVHRLARGGRQRARVGELLMMVGLAPSDARRYPHEFSGGQRQRIGIARALATQPRLLVCDEPVSALDVSIQAQILALLSDVRASLGLSYLFISHNLAVVRWFCDRIAVMYAGRIVEIGSAADVCGRAAHPYTRALLAAVPEPEARRGRIASVPAGEPADPIDPPPGCPFHPRCARATDVCRREIPRLELKPGLGPQHQAACHHPEDSN